MKTLFSTFLAVMMAGAADAAQPPQKEEEAKILYALGYALGNSIANFQLSPAEVPSVLGGLQDSLAGGKAKIEMTVYGPKIGGLERSRTTAALTERKKKNAAFLDKAAKEGGVVRLESGVLYTELAAGTGPSPSPAATVKAHYKGSLIDGSVFGTSHDTGQPIELTLGPGSIDCWKIAIPKMKVGGKAKLVCPADTAYKDEGRPPRIPGASILVFEVELVGIAGAK